MTGEVAVKAIYKILLVTLYLPLAIKGAIKLNFKASIYMKLHL
jgi:hypothetical protein